MGERAGGGATSWRGHRLQLMLQAAIGDYLAFDAFAFEEDILGASKIDVSRGEIA